MKEEKHATKEAINETAAGPILLWSKWEANRSDISDVRGSRDDRHRTQDFVNPGDETQDPLSGIQKRIRYRCIAQARSGCAKGALWTLAGERRKKSGEPEPRQIKV